MPIFSWQLSSAVFKQNPNHLTTDERPDYLRKSSEKPLRTELCTLSTGPLSPCHPCPIPNRWRSRRGIVRGLLQWKVARGTQPQVGPGAAAQAIECGGRDHGGIVAAQRRRRHHQ